MSGNWCLIESDPGVFTELIKGFGVQGVQVEELYSLDEAEFSNMRPVHGLVFLFKWRPGDEPIGTLAYDESNVYFAQQVITNACATQAIVNMLLNCEDPSIQLGDILTEFKGFTKDIDPASRGLCLSNSEPIRNLHNSFSRQTLFELDIKGGEKEDNYHFVTYMPIRGRVYELDGLRDAPLDLGEIKEGGDWLDTVRPIIQQRIQKYSEGEIHFNLMAVIRDKKQGYLQRLTDISESGMDTADVAEEICNLQQLIEEEEHKMAKYAKENERRRHNYIPFIVELMKILAKEGKLVPLVEQALEKAQQRSNKDHLKSKA